MKRFGSHYLYLPSHGFLKYHIVETDVTGHTSEISPMDEEVENVSWLPGVIVLLPEKLIREKETDLYDLIDFSVNTHLETVPLNYLSDNINSLNLLPVRLFPFDFALMQPTPDMKIEFL